MTFVYLLAACGVFALSVHAVPRVTRWSQWALFVLALVGAVTIVKGVLQ